MSENTIQLEIPILLPGVADERDQCVERLQEVLGHRKGLSQVHIERQNGKGNLCIHYDADYVPLAQVERWAKEAGVRVQQRYRHDKLHIANMDCADCAV